MSKGDYCKYMNCMCSENCEYAYEHRHGSSGYLCTRPKTEREKFLRDINLLQCTLDDLKRELEKIKEKYKEEIRDTFGE